MNCYSEHISRLAPDFQRLEFSPQTPVRTSFNQEDFYTDSTAFLQGETNRELFREAHDDIQMFTDTDESCLYPDEYNWMLRQMEKYMPGSETEETRKKLRNVSELANEALYTDGHEPLSPPLKALDMLNIENLLQWKQSQDRKHERFMMQEQILQHRDCKAFLLMNDLKAKTWRASYTDHAMLSVQPKFDSHLRPYKPVVKLAAKRTVKNREKKPDCWHFMRGHCKRGKYCDFNHDRKNAYPDACKVFLGGLPFHTSEESLKQQLLDQGFNVMNQLKIYGGFCPQVCLANIAEARRLITGGSIMIGGTNVDVRSYKAFTKKNQKKLEDVSRRSVFLGGLRKGTTSVMIKKKLESLGFKVMNYPLTKERFSPQVTLESVEQAQRLVKMLKVPINGALVDIRPYTSVGAKD